MLMIGDRLTSYDMMLAMGVIGVIAVMVLVLSFVLAFLDGWRPRFFKRTPK